MKILHTADNHLGREAFSNIDKRTGMNLRGLDYLASFKNVCKIALSERVDLFIIAGDMFDSPEPNQYYIIESMKLLTKISKAGITTLIINGNTDLSKKHNPLAYLSTIENLYVVTEPNTFILGSYDIVCVPYSTNFTKMLEQALLVSPSENKILVAHIPLNTAVQGSEVLERITPIDVSSIPDRFVYAALGHMHRFQQVEHSIPVFYSGSTERFNFDEEDEEKYALLVEVDGTVSVKPYRLQVRSMHRFDLDCQGLKTNEVLRKIDNLIEENKEHISDAIIKLILYNVSDKKDLDVVEIKHRFSDSFECIIDIKSREESIKSVSIPTLEEELDARLASLPQQKAKKIMRLREEIMG